MSPFYWSLQVFCLPKQDCTARCRPAGGTAGDAKSRQQTSASEPLRHCSHAPTRRRALRLRAAAASPSDGPSGAAACPVQRFIAAFNRRDLDAMVAELSEVQHC